MTSSDSVDILNSLAVSNLMLDNRMSNLKTKITIKQEEICKIEEEVRREQAAVARIEEDLVAAKSREERSLSVAQSLQQSKKMLDDLKWGLEVRIRATRESFQRVSSERSAILAKYEGIEQSYLAAYERLPFTWRRAEQKTARAKGAFLLKQASRELEEHRSKLRQLRHISGLRLKHSIVGFAKLMVSRERELQYLRCHLGTNSRLEKDFSEEKAALARSGVSLTLKHVPLPGRQSPLASKSGFTPIRERLGIKSAFSAREEPARAATRPAWQALLSPQGAFSPQAVSSMNSLLLSPFGIPEGTTVSLVTPTPTDSSQLADASYVFGSVQRDAEPSFYHLF